MDNPCIISSSGPAYKQIVFLNILKLIPFKHFTDRMLRTLYNKVDCLWQGHRVVMMPQNGENNPF